MAIQLTVCTPLFFFTEFTDSPRPRAQAGRFCRDVNAALNTHLAPGDSRELFAQEVPASDSWRIYEVLHEHRSNNGEKLRSILGSDPHLPFAFDSPRQISLPNYQPEEDACVSSTAAFASAVAEVEKLLPRFLTGSELAASLAVLAIYRDAIRISVREKEPIFWSY